MGKVELAIRFRDEAGNTRGENIEVDLSYPGDMSGEQRVAHILFSELRVTIGEQAAPKHNVIARQWLAFPGKPVDLANYFDVRNSQALWMELANLIMGAEGDLILAAAFKALEPIGEPSFDDEAAIDNLYYLHERKINLLNQAVHGLIKVQDLVNRLLHESLGGNLVEVSKTDWERTELTRDKVNKGLAAKLASRALSQSDFDDIKAALEIPRNTPKSDVALNYRNRLMHHIRPSIDYSMFFSDIESRAGQEIRDPDGNIVGRRHMLLARPPVQYRFEELYAAFYEYLDSLVAMLDKLSQIDVLRR